MPFAALVTRSPATGVAPGDAGPAWLGRRIAISLAPSVQSFVALRTQVRPSRAQKALIGFGDFVPQQNIEQILKERGVPDACKETIKQIADMPRLPNSGAELQSVREALGVDRGATFLRRDFTEERVKQEPLADYRIVYFATHAMLPHDFNCWAEPMLLTSPPTDAVAHEDGLLFASEIAELNLDADLVVLSACNTAGSGGGTGAESLSGLARAFFYAGSRALLVTHWPIPDRSTERLMTRTFHELASADVTVAEALRRAQVSLMADPATAHPFNWAAFSVVGDGGQRLGAGTASRPDLVSGL